MTVQTTTDWAAQARADLRFAIREAAKQLLETKHLYQSVTVDLGEAAKRVSNTNISEGNRSIFEREMKRSVDDSWEPAEPELPGVAPQQKAVRDRVHIIFPTIKTFCDRCDRVEPHNLVYARDITSDLMSRSGGYRVGPSQNFIAGYLCQACKVMLQYFMIRRDGVKLMLVGRSPMEHVAVPDVIPKSQRKYYFGAIIAFQSGQILPALFMLRVFLEQFAASQTTDKTLRADAVLDAYMSSLPTPVREHFTSPREMYGRLSEAVHAAREDADLYNEVLEQIVEHFEARRLYKVTTA
jgi:hypothetical protein